MSWYIYAKIGVSQDELNKRLKNIIRNHPFFKFLFEQYDIPIDTIDEHLTFKVKKMKGRYGQGNSKYIFLNEKIFEGKGPIEEKLHFIVHEITHWLIRQREKKFYFADPEEVEAFAYGIMFEIIRGESQDKIVELFYPIIEAHFNDKTNAKKLFNLLFVLASKKAQAYNNK